MNRLKDINLKLFYILSTMILNIIAYYIIDIRFDKWINYFSVLVVVQMIFIIYIMNIKKIPLLSLSTFFLVLSYLFHFGQLLLIGLINNYEFEGYNFKNAIDDNTYILAATFCFVVISAVALGILIGHKEYEYNINTNEDIRQLKLCKTLGYIITIFIFPMQLYIDLTNLIVSIKGNYMDTYTVQIPGLISNIAPVGFTGLILLIVGYSKNKLISTVITIVVIIYLCITMLSGHRAVATASILFIIYIYDRLINKINFKNIIVFIGIVFIGIVFINTIFEVRLESNRNITIFIDIFIKVLKSNPLFRLMEEFGGTFYTPSLTIKRIPEIIEPQWGKTYLYSFLYPIPNMGDILTPIKEQVFYAKFLDAEKLGGSYIGEIYYNFMYFGIIIAPILGYIVSKISIKLDKVIYERNLFNIAYFVPIFVYILLWVRGYFATIVSLSIWNSTIVYIIYKFIYGRKYNT